MLRHLGSKGNMFLIADPKTTPFPASTFDSARMEEVMVATIALADTTKLLVYYKPPGGANRDDWE
jgi:hypothetical protein